MQAKIVKNTVKTNLIINKILFILTHLIQIWNKVVTRHFTLYTYIFGHGMKRKWRDGDKKNLW